MKILLLGHKGMLGDAVLRVFKARNLEVETFGDSVVSRDFLYNNYHTVLQYDVIINCIGKIPQTSKNFSINCQLPIWLEELSGKFCKIIEAGSDCSYSGNLSADSSYKLYSNLDADSDYGLSKARMEKFVRMCDPKKHKIIKTSIIGIDSKQSSLLSWFLSKKDGEEVSGYTNHLWNGITTIEWAEVCYQLIINWQNDVSYYQIKDFPHYIQVGTHVVSKFHLLEKFNQAFKRDIKINPVESSPCNRSLFQYWHLGHIDDQLKKLRYFYEN
jgi:dTDP-4-dehydrorhamnose reductase